MKGSFGTMGALAALLISTSAQLVPQEIDQCVATYKHQRQEQCGGLRPDSLEYNQCMAHFTDRVLQCYNNPLTPHQHQDKMAEEAKSNTYQNEITRLSRMAMLPQEAHYILGTDVNSNKNERVAKPQQQQKGPVHDEQSMPKNFSPAGKQVPARQVEEQQAQDIMVGEEVILPSTTDKASPAPVTASFSAPANATKSAEGTLIKGNVVVVVSQSTTTAPAVAEPTSASLASSSSVSGAKKAQSTVKQQSTSVLKQVEEEATEVETDVEDVTPVQATATATATAVATATAATASSESSALVAPALTQVAAAPVAAASVSAASIAAVPAAAVPVAATLVAATTPVAPVVPVVATSAAATPAAPVAAASVAVTPVATTPVVLAATTTPAVVTPIAATPIAAPADPIIITPVASSSAASTEPATEDETSESLAAIVAAQTGKPQQLPEPITTTVVVQIADPVHSIKMTTVGKAVVPFDPNLFGTEGNPVVGIAPTSAEQENDVPTVAAPVAQNTVAQSTVAQSTAVQSTVAQDTAAQNTFETSEVAELSTTAAADTVPAKKARQDTTLSADSSIVESSTVVSSSSKATARSAKPTLSPLAATAAAHALGIGSSQPSSTLATPARAHMMKNKVEVSSASSNVFSCVMLAVSFAAGIVF
ncbi:hypothetical protein GGI25_004570 [Coemansia spiralis]|uniref:Uncharacterized protein n=1 Tax=Coemansia spiralis TaxID=417178 RepID=A0A9W8G076_9FUNG|nr:hypothetical protein GGI26_004802 [Coemansia sp. RSA 1358]KAJ2673823.1 hypothetical protein GGI25_004570 [Coemansia spiralis]